MRQVASRIRNTLRVAAIAVALMLAGASHSFGQFLPGTGPPDTYDPLTDEEQDNRQAQDTTKKKIRKPLESYFFGDSLRQRPNFVWNVDMFFNRIHEASVDSTLTGRQLNYPFYGEKGVGSAYQGQMGGATIPLDYAERQDYRNFRFAQAFDTYYFTPERARFFNVKRPLTQFSYYWSGQTSRYEEGFYITHAQNISPSTGFNIDYKSQGMRGFYAHSRARDKNLSMAFSHTGKKYTVHAGYIYNKVDNNENGGVQLDRHITDSIFELPQNIPVRLTSAKNVIRTNTAYVVQSYGFPLRKTSEEDLSISDVTTIFVGHSSQYSRWTKVYTDTKAGSVWKEEVLNNDGSKTSVEREFYDHWYINTAQTRDSLAESLLSNRAFIQIQPFDREGIVGLIDAGAGVDIHRYYMFHPDQYITGFGKPASATDYYVYGAIDGKYKKYLDWGARALFHPVGDRSGDFEIEATASLSAFIKGRPVTLSGRFMTELRSPNYWSERYYSNHFMWDKSFFKEKETRLDVKLDVPFWALELGLTQSVVADKIYYAVDKTAEQAVGEFKPKQHNGTVSVTGVYADKDFRFGGFHLRNRVLLQWSTQESVIPVPLVSAHMSYYFEFDVVKNVLRAQIGVDGRYNTRYYAPGYMPATAQFYNQSEKKLGGYPMLDFYLTGKWKRMRILLKFEHINENLFGQRNYFTLLHYPQHKRAFKLGFSWSFYD